MTPAPSGVVLDLGNVVVDWDPFHAVAAGVGAREAAAFLASTEIDFRAVNHQADAGRDWDDVLADVARDHPRWLPHVRAYREHFGASLRGEVPGTGDVVRGLHRGGVRLWGLTNWSHELWPHAPARFEVLSLLEDVVVSGTEGVAKPDPRIYAVLRERVGTPLDRLVFVDDRADNVAAGVEAGLDGVVFTDAARLREDLRARGLLGADPD